MHIHILGIGGTFMSGLASLARQMGHSVTGADHPLYPPMSTQIEKLEITVRPYDDLTVLQAKPDLVIVGNVITRGNPSIEYVLTHRLPFVSGPQWLYQEVLKNRWVLAVSGTHGKTTTTSLLTWILEYAGLQPGFLIGGIPENFGVSARLGGDQYFVIEADEYDSAFFDKRSKFMHYHPQTLIINNLEYDHADIFPDLAAIQQQFHYLVRTVPANGLIIHPAEDINVATVLQKGCWSATTCFHINDKKPSDWRAELLTPDGSQFSVFYQQKLIGKVEWNLLGQHNVNNCLAALAAAHHVQVAPELALQAVREFKNVKRRLEVKAKIKGITIYDDFAHHPTAIATTLAGLRAHIGDAARIIAVIEFGSYTMRSGVHKQALQKALTDANMVMCKSTEKDWGLASLLQEFSQPTAMFNELNHLLEQLISFLRSGDHVVIMSNSSFGGLHDKLLEQIAEV